MNLGEALPCRTCKKVYFQFCDARNTFSSNLNTTNLKMLLNHGGIRRVDTKFNKISVEKKSTKAL